MMFTTWLKKMVLTLALTIITAGSASAFEQFEGTIEGASSVINKTRAAIDANDPHIALERDFVLVTSDGAYLFMPNLNRTLKKASYMKNVRVSGKQNGLSIWVDRLEINENNRYVCVWDWKEQTEEMGKR